ncbi:MAG: hypothetical protein E6K78_04455 [Candidatus Eisenbacteria bacterium]|uniref:Uncharacterized protein n=1 Tax=Eiseniibacteriota bacterium TaxID=2212470 RepID=A0A538TVA2_UNCEI|nr:MAG: hypothetical protein E6K78_04455 [Candidatus Eisenbacteria bacterium]
MTRPLVMTLALAASALRAASSAAGPPTVTPSRLALPGLVAQRTIEREWTTAKDTGVFRAPGSWPREKAGAYGSWWPRRRRGEAGG